MWSSIDLNLSALDISLLNLLLQVTLLAGLILLASWRFKRNAITRYSILYSGMLVLPLLTVVSVALSGSGQSWLSMPLPQSAERQEAPFTVESSDQPINLEELILFSTGNSNEVGTTINKPWDSGMGVQSENPKLALYNIALMIWLAGLMIMIFGLLRSLHKIESIANKSLTPSTDQRETLAHIARDLGFNESLHYRISSSVQGPMLAGIVRPVLLIPPSFLDSLNTQQLKDVLTHEFAHVRRKDSLANFLQKLILAVFWFHPFIHLIDRAIDRAREEICDNHVLQHSKAYGYGETLLAIQNMKTVNTNDMSQSSVALGILSKHWKLEQRIAELLDSSRSQSVKLTNLKRSGLFSSILLTSIVLAGCQLQAAENQTPDQRIAELEQETRELQQQRLALQEQTRRLEELLQERVQEESQANENFRYRQQVLRSINELRSLLQAGDQTTQFQDLAELSQRVLDEIASTSDSQGAISLSTEAKEKLTIILNGLRNSTLNRAQLLSEVSDLSGMLDISPRASTVESETSTRSAPTANDRLTLSQGVYEQIVQIQELLSPEDSRQGPDLEAAKKRLDNLMESNFESMNNFEKTTTLNFLTNYWLANENYPETIKVFEQILQIDSLRPSVELRALRSLGQLYAAEENWQLSLENYAAWRELSATEDGLVMKGLAYGNYQLEYFSEALGFWEQYLELSRERNLELGRDDFVFLNGLYFELEMYSAALANTKEMVVQFNNPKDWQNLRSIYAQLGMLDAIEFEQASLDSNAAEIELPIAIDYTPFITPLDGEYLPVVATAPMYPSRAAQDGVEGWVLVSFTVDEQGDVISDSVDVVDADPPLIFNRASIRAASQFKFQPRVTNGIGVPVAGVQYLFRYRLGEEDA